MSLGNRLLFHHELPKDAKEDDEENNENRIPGHENRVGKMIEIEYEGEENTIPGGAGDRRAEPHRYPSLLHKNGIREYDREESCLGGKCMGADRYRYTAPYLVSLCRIAHEEKEHTDPKEEIDGMEKSLFGIVDFPISDGLMKECNGIGGGTHPKCHAERIYEDNEEIHSVLLY